MCVHTAEFTAIYRRYRVSVLYRHKKFVSNFSSKNENTMKTRRMLHCFALEHWRWIVCVCVDKWEDFSYVYLSKQWKPFFFRKLMNTSIQSSFHIQHFKMVITEESNSVSFALATIYRKIKWMENNFSPYAFDKKLGNKLLLSLNIYTIGLLGGSHQYLKNVEFNKQMEQK